jgi:hypothetical protein
VGRFVVALLLWLVPVAAAAQTCGGPFDSRGFPTTALMGGAQNCKPGGVAIGAGLSLGGTYPNQTLSASGLPAGPSGNPGAIQFNNGGFAGTSAATLDSSGNAYFAGATTLNGSVAVNADRTGATDAEPAVAAALTTACAASPPLAVFFPAGLYVFNEAATIPSGCNDLTLYAAYGTATIRIGATNASNRPLFNATGNNYLTFQGLIFDGNVGVTSNENGLIGLNPPMVEPRFVDDQFINTAGGAAVWAGGGSLIAGTLASSVQLASFTGTISNGSGGAGTALSVSGVSGTISATQTIILGVAAGTTISSGSGSSWTVSASQLVASTTMVSAPSCMTLTSVPTGLVVGAYLVDTEEDPDLYVTSINSGTGVVCFQKPLADTLAVGTVRFTPAFVTTQNQVGGDTSFQTSSILNLVAQDVLQIGSNIGCLTPGTKISSIVGSTAPYTINITAPLRCPINSGTGIAAQTGIQKPTFINNRFDNLGMNLFTTGSGAATTSGPQSSGSSTLTFSCYTNVTFNCSAIGVIPGNLTAVSGTPAGVPAADLVTSGPTIASATATYAATLASPLTGNLAGAVLSGATISGTTLSGTVTSGAVVAGQILTGPGTGIPRGTTIVSGSGPWTISSSATVSTPQAMATGISIPFTVGQGSGSGYAVWVAFGAWFANTDGRFIHNTFRHTWSSPLFIEATSGFIFQNNIFKEDGLEFQAYNLAPSACEGISYSFNPEFIGEDCSGASGNGWEGDHNIGVKFVGDSYSGNGSGGVFICGGRDISFAGVHMKNNGQAYNWPATGLPGTTGAVGINLAGSCTFGQPGLQENVTIDGLDASDDQATATQAYGIHHYNGVTNNVQAGAIVATGNTVVGVDPALGIAAPPVVVPFQDVQTFTTSGTWTVPSWCSEVGITCVTRLRLIAGGPGGPGGGQGTYGLAAVSGGAVGGGGGCMDVTALTSTFSSPVSVTVGSGGTGGAGGTSGAGTVGAVGHDTTFGSYYTAYTGGRGYPGQPSAQSYGGASAGVGIDGSDATSSAAGAGNGAYGSIIGSAGSVGSGNIQGTQSTAGSSSSLTAASNGQAAPCISGSGSGGTMLVGSVVNGGAGAVAIGTSAASAGTSATTGTAGAGGSATGSGGLYPNTSGAGGGGANSGGTGGAGGTGAAGAYGCAGGGGGAGSVAGGAGGNGCPGYVVAVTNGG